MNFPHTARHCHPFVATPWCEAKINKMKLMNYHGNNESNQRSHNYQSSAFCWSLNYLGNTSTKSNNSWISNSHTLCSSSEFIYKRWRQRLLFPTGRIMYLRWKDLSRIDPTAQKPFSKSISVFSCKCKNIEPKIKLISHKNSIMKKLKCRNNTSNQINEHWLIRSWNQSQ